MDKEIAKRAGLGFIGKNTLLIHPEFGSSHNIGYLLLDVLVEPDEEIQLDCGQCNACMTACPQKVIGENSFDAHGCLSYITQWKNAAYTPLNGCFYGCDICMRACPYNRVGEKNADFIFNENEFSNLSKRAFKGQYGHRDFAWIGKDRICRNIDWIKKEKMMGNIHELKYLQDKVDELKEQGVYRTLPEMLGANGPVINLDGNEVINLSSNNYLGFANHPRLKKAATAAIEKYGVGPGAVRTINGNMDIHDELERRLAHFKHEEAVTVYQSGFNCNSGTIQAITDRGDLIISDSLNHASIIDGVRLSRADKAVYQHSDMEDLERILKENQGKYNVTLIITDGVFSMDGDLAKLPKIVELAEQYGALTYVDDAHGSGVLGECGRGTVDHFGLHGRIDFIIGTLSKGFGCLGGYVASKKVTKEWLSHRGRPILFSTSLPPAIVAALIEAVGMLEESSEYTDRLWDNARYFKEELGKLGFNTGHSETPITPVIIGDEAKAVAFSKELLKNGVYACSIVFPTVPMGTGRLRCMITAEHTKENLKQAVEVFEKVGKEMGLI
ncbi:MAG: glycine C-acetyltransferase, partial [Tissierellia bacterium]|nr:glycine C-acetyltransferase [Tissierellia bacterium]